MESGDVVVWRAVSCPPVIRVGTGVDSRCEQEQTRHSAGVSVQNTVTELCSCRYIKHLWLLTVCQFCSFTLKHFTAEQFDIRLSISWFPDHSLTWAVDLHGDLRLPGEVQQPALAVDLQLGAGDLLLVLGYSSPEHPEDLLGGLGEPLVDEQPQHLDFRHFNGSLREKPRTSLTGASCSVVYQLHFRVSVCAHARVFAGNGGDSTAPCRGGGVDTGYKPAQRRTDVQYSVK